ncbi:MAG: 4'-phosphopantetheinyl transferase superfamily protein [Ignavibacteriales bacterium]|nr:4'-phosphopantetheinyl transferase superfamily protein [Ignavibacteriales bacterium]
MIQIYYAYTDILLNNNLEKFIGQLSLQSKSKLSFLKRVEDQQLLLTSLVLLLKALKENDCENFKLSDMQYNITGKPFFPGSPFDFNISHTDNCAAIVFSKDCRVGIDVERIKEIDFSDFTDYFTTDQWNDIYSAEDKFKRFYFYWTLIESVVKADGRGLSLISTKRIKLVNGDLFIDNAQWFYNHYNIDKFISCCITTDKKIKSYEIKKITSI